MHYTFDAKKLSANVAKHQVWFHQADDFEWESSIVWADTRKRYGETRFNALGLIESCLYVMVFTLRAVSVRIISLRRANNREKVRYAKAFNAA